jgi:hypothetical protein
MDDNELTKQSPDIQNKTSEQKTEYSPAQDELWRSRNEYISTRWKGIFELLSWTLNRILNYLFALNTGGLVASLTYIATKPRTNLTTAAIIFFALGVLFILLHAAWYYYYALNLFNAYKTDVTQYYESNLDWKNLNKRDEDWKNLNKRDEERSEKDSQRGFYLGWGAGLAFVFGLYCGIAALWT